MTIRSVLFVSVISLGFGCATGGAPEADDSTSHVDAAAGNTTHDADQHASADASHGSGSGSGSGTCSSPFSGVIATWDFTSASGSQTTTSSSNAANGVIAGDIGRSSQLVASTGSGSINSSNWSTSSSDDQSTYYTLSVTPPSGCSLSLSSMSIEAKASGTGPSSVEVGTSDDSFGSTSSITTAGSTSTPALSVNGASDAVEVRVFGYGASGSNGTLRLSETLTLTGSIN
jgi:hypothetical protein